MPKKYQAHSANVVAVENGFIIHLSTHGTSVALVAKAPEEMLALLAEVEFKPPVYSLDEPGGMNSSSSAGVPTPSFRR